MLEDNGEVGRLEVLSVVSRQFYIPWSLAVLTFKGTSICMIAVFLPLGLSALV